MSFEPVIDWSVINRSVFNESLHPRGTGAQGGQFVAEGASKQTGWSSSTSKAASKGGGGKGKGKGKGGADSKGDMSFDGKRGPGYGVPGGDKRVHSLQQALNKLGFTDASGAKLKDDGKLGPKTTAAVKKAQRALGLKADGVVTPALLKQLAGAKDVKSLRSGAAAAKKAAADKAHKAAAAKKKAAAKKATPKKAPPERRVTPKAPPKARSGGYATGGGQ